MTKTHKDLEWTGERYVPQLRGGIALEHLHRYAFASSFVADKDVLDIASGEGYGSEILGKIAKSVIGVDVDEASVLHANSKYGSKNISFTSGDAYAIPLPNEAVDVVVSFETIEHVEEHETMVREFKRVMKPDGLVVISSPERGAYNKQNTHENPYHKKELDLEEFNTLLKRNFRNVRIFGQRHLSGSSIFPGNLEVENTTTFQFSDLPKNLCPVKGLSKPLYLLALCSDQELPVTDGSFCNQSIEETDFAAAMICRIAESDSEKIEILIKKIKEMQSSLSWRLTSPLRNLRDWLWSIGE